MIAANDHVQPLVEAKPAVVLRFVVREDSNLTTVEIIDADIVCLLSKRNNRFIITTNGRQLFIDSEGVEFMIETLEIKGRRKRCLTWG